MEEPTAFVALEYDTYIIFIGTYLQIGFYLLLLPTLNDLVNEIKAQHRMKVKWLS